jgi:hypothetical protein
VGKKHPLDVFRSSGSEGFKKASHGRRTVAGKVIASSVKRKSATGKSAPRKVPLSTGRPKRERAFWPFGRKPTSPKARRAEGSSRTVFYAAVTIVALVALVVAISQTFHDDVPAKLPSLKMGEAITRPEEPEQAPPQAPPATPVAFTILAATYNGSDNGREQALAAQAELVQRFFTDPLVVGYPDPDEPGSFDHYALLVGRAGSEAELARDLARLRAIDDWQGGKSAPFVSAAIQELPTDLSR